MLALEMSTAELAQWRASMHLLLAAVYGRTFPYSVTSRVGGVTVTGHVTRHAVPYLHAGKPDTLLAQVTPAFEAALNDIAAVDSMPPPHQMRLRAFLVTIAEFAPELVGEDAEAA